MINSEELRKIQKPIKDKYREKPDEALLTLKAEGKIGEGISCKIETGRMLAEAGLHPAAGGSGLLVCSGDMLLEALIACAGVTLSAVATSMGVEIKAGLYRLRVTLISGELLEYQWKRRLDLNLSVLFLCSTAMLLMNN